MLHSWLQIRSALTYALGALLTAVITLVILPLMLFPMLVHTWAEWHRRRAGFLLHSRVIPRAAISMSGLRPWPKLMANEPTLRRDFGWLPIHIVLGGLMGLLAFFCLANIIIALVIMVGWQLFPANEKPNFFWDISATNWIGAVGIGLIQIAILAAIVYWVIPVLARGHARFTMAVLAPSAAQKLAQRVDVLTESRKGVLDAHSLELRRIERDLHDGTQARLVAIAMQLAVARESLAENPELVVSLLRQAHEGAEEAMTELRDVIRTVYPPILSDRGLAGSITALAARSTVPTHVTTENLETLPAAVEAAAYFVVAEALTNIAKHSHARHATVSVRRIKNYLFILITDDGVGEADSSAGTGLEGIHRRVLALDGSMHVSSPVGGPTSLAVELPCES